MKVFKTKYLVSEEIDEDGGFGDAVTTQKPIAVFDRKQDAQEYIKQYSKDQLYDSPYQDLYFGILTLTEVIENPTVPAKELPEYEDRSDWF